MPKYMMDKSFGKSLYSSDYDGEKVSKPYNMSEVHTTLIAICRATISGPVVQLVMVTRLAGDIKQLSTKNQPISNWAVILLSTFYNIVHKPILLVVSKCKNILH